MLELRLCKSNMLSSTKYPIEICCVVEDHAYIDTDIEMVNEYTCNLGLKFKLREYDTWKYSDDRNSITSLPAFHIYFGDGYVDTFYPGEKIFNSIDECVKNYEQRRVETKRFIEPWKNVLTFWKTKKV